MAEIECGFNGTADNTGAEFLVAYGPTLIVDIGFDPDWKSGDLVNVPKPSIQNITALVDTGATESCIDDALAVQLKLPVIDERPIGGSVGQHIAKMYLAQIRVPSLPFTIWGSFAGVHLIAGGQIHKALIGRTFLQSFTMTYNGITGQVTIKSE